MATNYDLSDLTQSNFKNYDLSDLMQSNSATPKSPTSNFFGNFLDSIKKTGNKNLIEQTGLNTKKGMEEGVSQTLPFAAALVPGIGEAEGVSALPVLGRYALNKLGNFGVGSALGTASSELNPENKNSLSTNLKNNLIGNALLESIGPVARIAGKGMAAISPQNYAQQMVKKLSGLDLGKNARIFAQKIQDAYNLNKNEVGNDYNMFFASPSVRNNSIGNTISKPNGYLNVDKKIINKYPPDAEDAHYNFVNNPTLYNAHLLRHELDEFGREFQSKPLSIPDSNLMKKVKKTRDILNSNMNEGFDLIDPKLRDQYADINQKYIDNVVPYFSNSKIRDIVETPSAKIKASQVKNLSNEFENPNEKIQKIANDIGPSANYHIMADKFGQLQGKANPEKLQSTFNDLKNKGYSQYITPEMEDMFHSLGNRQKMQMGMQGAPGALLGLGLSKYFGPVGTMIETPALTWASMQGLRKAKNLLPEQNPFANQSFRKGARLAGRLGINYLNNS